MTQLIVPTDRVAFAIQTSPIFRSTCSEFGNENKRTRGPRAYAHNQLAEGVVFIGVENPLIECLRDAASSAENPVCELVEDSLTETRLCIEAAILAGLDPVTECNL